MTPQLSPNSTNNWGPSVQMPETMGSISCKPQRATVHLYPSAGWGIPEMNLRHTWEVALLQAPLEQRGQGGNRTKPLKKTS